MLQFSYAWIDLLVDVSLKSLLLAGLAFLAIKLIRVRNVNVQHRIWMAVMIAMLALPCLVQVMPRLPLPGWMSVQFTASMPNEALLDEEVAKPATKTPVEANVAETELADGVESETPMKADWPSTAPFTAFTDSLASDDLESADVDTVPVVDKAVAAEDTASIADIENTAPAEKATSPVNLLPYILPTLTFVYLAVGAVLLLRIAIGLFLARRMVSAAKNINDEVGVRAAKLNFLQSDATSVPVTIGFLRPTVVLPPAWRDWSEEKLRSALAHELAHVRRSDWLVSLLSEFNRALHWFNPLAWKLRRTLSDLAENNCDDAVIEAEGNRTEYARHLLEVAATLAAAGKRYRPVQTSVAMARRPAVETRIDAILDDSRPLAQRLGAIGGVCLLAVVLPAVFVTASLRATQNEESVEAADDTLAAAEDENMITGRVLDAAGEPVANVEVVLSTIEVDDLNSFRIGFPVIPERFRHTEVSRAKTNAEGSFEFSNKHIEPYSDETILNVSTVAGKHGVAWKTTSLKMLADELSKPGESLELQVAKSETIQGRIIDPEGNPRAGVSVSIASIYRPHADANIEEWIADSKSKKQNADLKEMIRHRERFGDQYPIEWGHGPLRIGNPTMPKDAVTDAQGKFTISGVGKDQFAFLVVRGDEIATTTIQTIARKMNPIIANPSTWNAMHTPTHFGSEFTFVSEPTRPVVGVVKDKDTGKPIAGARVQLNNYANHSMYQEGYISCITNEKGEYRLEGLPLAIDHRLEASGPIHEPYYSHRTRTVADTAKSNRADFQLKRGIWLHGRVAGDWKDESVNVAFYPLLTNDLAQDYGYDPGRGSAPRNTNSLDKQGRFRVLAMPGEGVIVARSGNREAFLGVDPTKVSDDLKNGRSFKVYHGLWPIDGYNAWAKVNVDADVPREVELRVKRGLHRKLEIVDQDGVEVAESLVAGTPSTVWSNHGEPVTINAMKPGERRRIAILHEKRRLGRMLEVKASDQPLRVTLLPCTLVQGRVVDDAGDGVANVRIRTDYRSGDWTPNLTITDTDEKGGFEVLLPPGGTCHLGAYSMDDESPTFSIQVEAKPNQVVALGDIKSGTRLDTKATDRMSTIKVAQRRTKASKETDAAAAETPFVYEGQVITPDGKPAADAKVRLVYWFSDNSQTVRDEPDATTNENGRFRFEMNEGDFYHTADSSPPWAWASIVATKEGYGLATAASIAFEKSGQATKAMRSNPNHNEKILTDMLKKHSGPIRLVTDNTPITGRVISTEGQPIKGVKVTLVNAATGDDQTLDKWLEAAKTAGGYHDLRHHAPRRIWGRVVAKLLPAVRTDAKGEFQFPGIGDNQLVELLFESPNMESTVLTCRTQVGDKIEIKGRSSYDNRTVFGSQVNHVAIASRPVTGTVTDENGKPMADVRVISPEGVRYDGREQHRTGSRYSRSVTDENGLYKLTGLPKSKFNRLEFRPPVDSGNLMRHMGADTTGSGVDAVQVDTS